MAVPSLTQSVYEVSWLETSHVGNHDSQQGVTKTKVLVLSRPQIRIISGLPNPAQDMDPESKKSA